MKKYFSLLCCLALFALGCSPEDIKQENPPHTGQIPSTNGNSSISVSGVSLNAMSFELSEGESYTLTATVQPSNATNKNVSWKSDNTSVATVSNGIVTAIKEGTATITVTTIDKGKTASCMVIVIEDDYILTLGDRLKNRLILNGYDLNNDRQISRKEGAKVTSFDIGNNEGTNRWDDEDIAGLNQLTNLTSLDCHGNRITCLNLSGFKELKTLDCHYNDLTTLDLTACTSLESLHCGCNLTYLDVSQLSNLKRLDCSFNSKPLQLSELPSTIEYISLYSTELTSTIKVTNLEYLETFNCGYSNFKSLDLSGCSNLKWINCEHNGLKTLSLTGCTNIEFLWAMNNELSSLDVSNNSNLCTLECNDNNIVSLNISGCQKLRELRCSNNKITSLDLSGFKCLESVSASSNSFTTLDVASSRELVWLWVPDTLRKLYVSYYAWYDIAKQCIDELEQ